MFELLTRKKSKKTGLIDHGWAGEEHKRDTEQKESQSVSETFRRNCTYNGNSLVQYSLKLLSSIAKEKEISQGAFFLDSVMEGKKVLKFLSGYATPDPRNIVDILEIGEGIPGQVAKDGEMINLKDIPEGSFEISSGLGQSSSVSLIAFPVIHNEAIIAVIELASFHQFNRRDEEFFKEISPLIAEQLIRIKNVAN